MSDFQDISSVIWKKKIVMNYYESEKEYFEQVILVF